MIHTHLGLIWCKILGCLIQERFLRFVSTVVKILLLGRRLVKTVEDFVLANVFGVIEVGLIQIYGKAVRGKRFMDIYSDSFQKIILTCLWQPKREVF